MSDIDDEANARRLDEGDPGHRDLFHIPPAAGGRYPDTAYFAGNSLGLQPKATVPELLEDLGDWAELGVEGHLEAGRPWLPYHALLTEPAARLVGAQPNETVIMNSLSVNLHLLMVSFYRPTAERYRIAIEDAAFPSDSYAVRSQARFHGFDPDDAIVRLRPRDGEDTLHTGDIVERFAGSDDIALVLLGAVNYLTGELLDLPAITAAGRAGGAVVGWDLAHAAGNVPLQLHDWDVDFAAWCSYKYLNSGPGRPRRSVRPRAPRRPHRPAAVRGLVEHGRVHPLRDDADLASAGDGRRVADLESADLLDGPGAHVAWSCSTASAWTRCASGAFGSPATWSRCSTRSRRPDRSRS